MYNSSLKGATDNDRDFGISRACRVSGHLLKYNLRFHRFNNSLYVIMLTRTGTFVFSRPRRTSLRRTAGLKHLHHFSRHIQHPIHECPVYCWLAEGFLRKESTQSVPIVCFYIYMEYRNVTGASQYHSKEFLYLNDALSWLENEVEQCVMPAISTLQTRRRPVCGVSIDLNRKDIPPEAITKNPASLLSEFATAS